MATFTNLPIGSLLHSGNYRIERILGKGGFGITYLAFDLSLERHVAIKEFFPEQFCNREGTTSQVSVAVTGNEELVTGLKNTFLNEARKLAQLNHPNIVRVYAAFEENGTAYYVMDYIEGKNLEDVIREYGPMPDANAIDLISKIGSALEYLHERRLNHLDVKPANIVLRKTDNQPVLIDFGLAKHYNEKGSATKVTPTGYSHGFAPIEQYFDGGVDEFSPTSDIYSLAATLYYAITGHIPPAAPQLQDTGLLFPDNVAPYLQNAILRAMAVAKKDRHQSMSEFIQEIKFGYARPYQPSPAQTVIKPASGPVPGTPNVPKKKNNTLLYCLIGLFALIVGGSLFFIFKPNPKSADISPLAEGKASVETPASAPDLALNGHERVDLGLSVNWSACNLGATSPTDYGEYYTWGRITPGFSYSYCSSSSSISGNTAHDAATAEWGDAWRMPTSEECNELIKKCRWHWTKKEGVSGYEVTGPNGNSIFLPASGYYKDGALEFFKTNGNYWSATPKGSTKAYYISFHKTYVERRVLNKDRARSIRPVTNH